jgi:hypothetical protein
MNLITRKLNSLKRRLISKSINNYESPKLDFVDNLIEEINWLFVTLYAKSTDKMPRQHTSNRKIPKVSKAIASSFY